MHAIEFQSVSFAYGRQTVLDGLSFSVEAGQFTALLGRNGAGKSTVFNLIAGLLMPDQGKIMVGGMDIAQNSIAARKEIGVLFQQSALDLELTVAQNLRYSAGLYGLDQISERIARALERLELSDIASRPVRDLSGGYRRRVEIARALLHEPKLLVLDEPTVGLDPASKDSITAHVHDLARSGVSVLWITHMLDEIEDDDHVILLEDGALREAGSFEALGGAAALKTRYRSANERAAL